MYLDILSSQVLGDRNEGRTLCQLAMDAALYANTTPARVPGLVQGGYIPGQL